MTRRRISGSVPDVPNPLVTDHGVMTDNVYDESPPQIRKFHRSREDRMIAGVCGGVAKSIGVDAALVRLGLVAATLLGFGAGAVIYVAAWILLPEQDGSPS